MSTRLVPAVSAGALPENSRRVVTIFLNGGNDGLNTIIPARDPLYAHYRNNLRIKPEEAIHLDDDTFLHPAMRGLSGCWDSGRLSIQQGVGYPNHSRSHFVSTAVWSEGNLDATLPSFNGWLARTLDPLQANSQSPLACAIDSPDTPELLRGRITRTVSMPQLPREESQTLARVLEQNQDFAADSAANQFVLQASRDAAASLRKSAASSSQFDGFPDTTFGHRMGQVASVIESLPEIKAVHAVHDGYDTHSGQRPRHSSLLRELADGLAAIDRFLSERGLSGSTLIMVFSEFGRRVQENASHGTDHGAAAPVLLIGGGSEPGLHGASPDLENLVDGDITVTSDFRELQAVASQWLVSNEKKMRRS
ncbi:DUF1501 domain-containing protein [Novipirellula rosea]|uniref:DUF1501 domain-containing protein n=2 Tax=Novipirellula rosea TaxID=1031540 RepID=A0ABP8MMM3_9BACT